MGISTETPPRPYVFKSGKRKGKAAEVLMFQDYSFLHWMLRKLNSENPNRRNNLHEHLEWLFKAGENRSTKKICPHCQAKKVEFFSVRRSFYARDFSIGLEYTCCANSDCMDKLRAWSAEKEPEFLPFKWSALNDFEYKGDIERVINRLFKPVFGLPKRMTRKTAFDFFSEEVTELRPSIIFSEKAGGQIVFQPA
jgi:hypothetical protein